MMRGLFPFLRELFFGPPKPKSLRCAYAFNSYRCSGIATPVCGSGMCAQHHKEWCFRAGHPQDAPPLCAAPRRGHLIDAAAKFPGGQR